MNAPPITFDDIDQGDYDLLALDEPHRFAVHRPQVSPRTQYPHDGGDEAIPLPGTGLDSAEKDPHCAAVFRSKAWRKMSADIREMKAVLHEYLSQQFADDQGDAGDYADDEQPGYDAGGYEGASPDTDTEPEIDTRRAHNAVGPVRMADGGISRPRVRYDRVLHQAHAALDADPPQFLADIADTIDAIIDDSVLICDREMPFTPTSHSEACGWGDALSRGLTGSAAVKFARAYGRANPSDRIDCVPDRTRYSRRGQPDDESRVNVGTGPQQADPQAWQRMRNDQDNERAYAGRLADAMMLLSQLTRNAGDLAAQMRWGLTDPSLRQDAQDALGIAAVPGQPA